MGGDDDYGETEDGLGAKVSRLLNEKTATSERWGWPYAGGRSGWMSTTTRDGNGGNGRHRR